MRRLDVGVRLRSDCSDADGMRLSSRPSVFGDLVRPRKVVMQS
jgi:hypothetical protein